MSTQDEPARYLPYPELVEPEFGAAPFAIYDSRATSNALAGAVDKLHRRMLVPLEHTGAATRLHELGHVRWSPLSPPKVRFDRRVYAAVEDARINLAVVASCGSLALSADNELYVAYLLARDQKDGDRLAVWLRSIASIGTSAEPVVATWLQRWPDGPKVAEAMEWVRDELERARLSRESEAAPEPRGRAIARKLVRMLRAEGALDARGFGKSAFELDCATCHAHEGEAELDLPARRRSHRERAEKVLPGHMRITRAAMSRARSALGGTPGWRAASEGSVVRYAHRWSTDRAIFRKRARRARGTILVDASGSMRLSPGDLDRLLASTRAGLLVALYAGDGEKGELRIVADGAARASDSALARFGTGNVVDLPALEWLARQHGPRFWVSDGGVTGIGDRSSRWLRDQCERVRARAAIRRVENVDALIALLRAEPAARGGARARAAS